MLRLPRSPAFWYAAFAVAFVACRVALFAFTAAAEYNLYKDYGDTAREQGLGELYRTRSVEYPQLAVVFGALAGTIGDSIPEWASHLRDLRPDPARGEEGSRYEVGLGIVLFAVDVSCLLLVLGIARRIYPHEGPAARVARLAAYTALTGAVGLIFYDRQDPVVAWCALLAILAFLEGRTPLAYAILVAGTAFKLVPALLLPVFVFAAAAVRAGPGATPGRYIRAVVREAAVAAVLLALWPVLTYWLGGGDRAFGYLTYHSARGLQLEAPLGWLMLLVDPSGTEVGHSFGGYTLRGELPDRVAKVCAVAMALGAGLAALASVRGFRRLMNRFGPPASSGKKGGDDTAARVALGPHLVAASLLVWMVFIVTNKVGSPQFLLWVGPLAPLLPLRTWASWVWAALLLLACGLSTVIFPCAYPSVIGRHLHDEPSTWAGPVPWAHFILAAKAVILAVVTLWLAAWVWRSPGPAAPPAPEPVR